MSDLHAQITAAVEERLDVARAATPGPWRRQYDLVVRTAAPEYAEANAVARTYGRVNTAHVALNDPAFVILECEAELELLAHAASMFALEAEEPGSLVIRGAANAYRVMLRQMATVYGIKVDG